MYMFLAVFLFHIACTRNAAAFDHTKIQTSCFMDICNYQRYCDNATKRCEFCTNRFSTCFTSRQEPQCTIFCMLNKPCPPLGQLENGSKNDTDREYLVGETVLFICDIGYHNTGVETTKCTNYGIWSHQQLGVKPPICEADVCPIPNPPDHGRVWLENNTVLFRVGDKVHYLCENGFKLSSGNETQICYANGQWSGAKPECNENTCKAPKNPRHCSIGYPRNTSILKVGTEITYTCAVGYRLNGPRTRKCGMNGEWIESEPACVESSCKVLENPDHGIILYPVNTSIFDVGADITYRCDTGFKLQGSELRRCKTGGQWGGNAPKCVPVECNEPVAPRNGYKVILSASLHFLSDSIVQFKCNSGYLVKGHITLRCLSNGTWDGDVPICTAERQWIEVAIIMCTISGVAVVGIVILVIYVCHLHKTKRQNRVDRKEKKYEPIKNKTEEKRDKSEAEIIALGDYATIDMKEDVSMLHKAVPKGLPPRHESDETMNATVYSSADDRRITPIFTGNVAACNFICGHMNSLNQDENKTMTTSEPPEENKGERSSQSDRTNPITDTVDEYTSENSKSVLDNNEHDGEDDTVIAQETVGPSKSADFCVATMKM